MEIPYKVIQAAAQALCQDDHDTGLEGGDGFSWEQLPEYHREMYRESARAILEAAFMEGEVLELNRIQFGPKNNRRYTQGGVWDSRPLSHFLNMVHGEENLVVEKKLTVTFEFDPIAVTDHEGF